jgi:hypothetical protein
MSGRLNWRRACKRRPSESKYGAGVVLDNGSITPRITPDDLAKRAESAMRDWIKTLHRRDRERLQ